MSSSSFSIYPSIPNPTPPTSSPVMGSGFKGNVLVPNTAGYIEANDIYATSTYGAERDLNPRSIYQPVDITDICTVLTIANGPKPVPPVTTATPATPVAIRTGGHQYSGASSTQGTGIQLDLQPTFRDPVKDLTLIRKDGKVFIRSSVSWKLQELYNFLLENGVFLPTGQCVTVCLGGHVQTGGYGMLGRSFGLLGDYITELEIVDHTGTQVTASKDSNQDLFYGFLGGSPGNLGVLTHFTVEVQDDNDYKGSKGMWLLFLYNKETLQNLLDILAEKAGDASFERNYDFNINVYSKTFPIGKVFPASDEELKHELPDEHQNDYSEGNGLTLKQPVIVVYAQWVNFGNAYDSTFFDALQNAGEGRHSKPVVRNSDLKEPMSKITSKWLFKGDREFPYPYAKHTGSTNSTSLSSNGWSAWFAGQIEKATKTEGLFVSSQIQVYGGNNSMFWKNASDATAYSWRDATVVGTWDVFYNNAQAAAEAWQEETAAGALTYFDSNERRLLWGSYGNWDMTQVWQHYYDPATYQRLQQIRKTYDPNGLFTANPFCVQAAT